MNNTDTQNINIRYIIENQSIHYILQNEIPLFNIKLDSDSIIKIYKLSSHLNIGVYSGDILDNQSYNNISRMDNTIQMINKINNEYKKLYNSFDILVDNKVFNEVDVQYYTQKLNDKLKKHYDNFVEIINNLDMNLVK